MIIVAGGRIVKDGQPFVWGSIQENLDVTDMTIREADHASGVRKKHRAVVKRHRPEGGRV